MTVHVTPFADGLPRRAFTAADAYRLVEATFVDGLRLKLADYS